MRIQSLSFGAVKTKKFSVGAEQVDMPPRRKLSDVDRGRALAWLQDGLALREVARRLGVSPSTISRLNHRFNDTGTVRERERSGRPRVTNAREDRILHRAAVRARFVTASNLRRDLRAAANVNISEQTVRRRLHEFGLRSRVPAVRPRLTQAHKVARLDFCRRHERWTRQQWANVLFSDESRFSLVHNDGRMRVWRRPGERFVDANVREVVPFGGGSIMVWGGFSLHHRTPLHLVQGNLTGVRYMEEIVRPLVLPALQQMRPGAVFQDDNARPHRARVVQDYLQASGINRMDWPACSPDLNPIENLWDELERRIKANHPPPRNAQHLFDQLQAEWQALPQRVITNLIHSMRRRCVECRENRGGHTHY